MIFYQLLICTSQFHAFWSNQLPYYLTALLYICSDWSRVYVLHNYICIMVHTSWSFACLIGSSKAISWYLLFLSFHRNLQCVPWLCGAFWGTWNSLIWAIFYWSLKPQLSYIFIVRELWPFLIAKLVINVFSREMSGFLMSLKIS